jgi:hypothetical protein
MNIEEEEGIFCEDEALDFALIDEIEEDKKTLTKSGCLTSVLFILSIFIVGFSLIGIFC